MIEAILKKFGYVKERIIYEFPEVTEPKEYDVIQEKMYMSAEYWYTIKVPEETLKRDFLMSIINSLIQYVEVEEIGNNERYLMSIKLLIKRRVGGK